MQVSCGELILFYWNHTVFAFSHRNCFRSIPVLPRPPLPLRPSPTLQCGPQPRILPAVWAAVDQGHRGTPCLGQDLRRSNQCKLWVRLTDNQMWYSIKFETLRLHLNSRAFSFIFFENETKTKFCRSTCICCIMIYERIYITLMFYWEN